MRRWFGENFNIFSVNFSVLVQFRPEPHDIKFLAIAFDLKQLLHSKTCIKESPSLKYFHISLEDRKLRIDVKLKMVFVNTYSKE